MPGGPHPFRVQPGTALAPIWGDGPWIGDGRRAGVAAVDDAGPHRPVQSAPRPAERSPARGDRPGQTPVAPQSSHRQR